MSRACCGNSHFELTKSSKCHITELFLLFIGDQVTDIIVLSRMYYYFTFFNVKMHRIDRANQLYHIQTS